MSNAKGTGMRDKTIAAALLLVAARATAGDIVGVVQGVKDPENVVVYLEHVDGVFAPPTGGTVMDQRNIRFVPHVLPVLSGTEVRFPNSDTVRHNVFSPSRSKKFNLGIYPAGVTKTVVMDIPGAQVVALLCNIHANLAAFIVVLQNPYFAKPDNEGKFAIKDVPSGAYTLVAWHERQPDPPKEKVTVTSKGEVRAALTFVADFGRTGQ